jgi:D-serine deaminase-like pyridoxal phosphate-dependent protein
MHIVKPTLLIDEIKCKENIRNMLKRCKDRHLSFRPHFKTHQSLDVGQWFKALGISKIAVSSLSMANYFSKQWDDILVAFPANILEIDLINDLAGRIRLSLLVESLDTLECLGSKINFPINLFVKIDTGYGRTGIRFDNFCLIDKLLEKIKNTRYLNFSGFLSHSGDTYQCRGKDEVNALHLANKKRFTDVKKRYLTLYPNLILSYGDTPGASIADDFDDIDELRPGNFVCYDVTQVHIGSCDFSQIAVVLACPIVAIHKERSELIIYGGAIHLSKDALAWEDKGNIYGLIAIKTSEGWGQPIENAYVSSISQEHGKIKMSPTDLVKYNVGDILYIYPIHSCLVISSMRSFTTLKGRKLNVYEGLT